MAGQIYGPPSGDLFDDILFSISSVNTLKEHLTEPLNHRLAGKVVINVIPDLTPRFSSSNLCLHCFPRPICLNTLNT